MTTRPEVKEGQVWSDNDKRLVGRKIQVVYVGSTGADIKVLASPASPNTVGRIYSIRLDRFIETRQTGYTLLEDV